MSALSSKELRALRARAHALKPTVRIAGAGLSEAVLRELDRTLDAHELIKIHAAVDERAQRTELLEALCQALGAQPVQIIGKMLVAFRPRAEEPAADRNTVAARARERPEKRATRATRAARKSAVGVSRKRSATVAIQRRPRKSPPRRRA
jgi:RNA-binding protein